MSGRAGRAAGVVVGVAVASALLVTCFVTAGHAPALHGVQVATVAPDSVRTLLQQGLDRAVPGAIDLVPSPGPGTARAAVTDRAAYAAFVVTPSGGTLSVARAASAPVAAALEAAFTHALAATHRSLTVVDLRPLPAGDPQGVSSLLTVIPLSIASLAAAVVLWLVDRDLSGGIRLALLLLYAVVAGLLAGLVGATSGAFAGHGWTVALGGGALALAVSWFTAGALRLLGPAGAGLSGVLVIALGFPSSGGATAPQMLPTVWRTLSPLLPPGAAVPLLRNLVYFDGHAIGGPLLTLGVFALLGLVGCLVPRRSDRSRPAEPTTGTTSSPAVTPA